MPLFITDDELARHTNDAPFVAARADDYIRRLQTDFETVKAAADANAVTAEQTCSLLEHKFLSLSAEFSTLQSQNAQLQSSFDDRLSELAEVQAQKHQLHLQSMGKDGEIERLATEVSELRKTKRQLMELVEQKDTEISDKKVTINSYLDKIVNLTESASKKEARLSEVEAELARSQAICSRLSQKEIVERHNSWLNDELTTKVDSLIELRIRHSNLEEDMSVKLADAERQLSECSSSAKRKKERVEELEAKLTSLQEELCSTKDTGLANEEQLSAELSTANKLVELYKQSSEEWSRKAGELEGVIRALEKRSIELESDYKERLEKEIVSRSELEKDAADLRSKLELCEAEIESNRKNNELHLLPLSSFSTESWKSQTHGNDNTEGTGMLIPKIPPGVSGTALAASLLRDGWSLAKMYAKYQEAVDAFRHEQLGRKESEAVLQRVLFELEEKAGVILDERADYERMVESYSIVGQKLQQSMSEQGNLERIIQELKAELRRRERQYDFAQKDIVDLQKQITVLLKECRDVQLRCGSGDNEEDYSPVYAADGMETDNVVDNVISERLLTFKDINGLVEQNVQLRSLVRSLSDQIENNEKDLKVKLELELKKHTDEAASRVATVLQRAEEQGQMIESLHTSVAMYKRLYEEEHKRQLPNSRLRSLQETPENGREDLLALLEGSQEASKKAKEKVAEQLGSLEEKLSKSRSEISSLQLERDKLASEAKLAGEKLERFMNEFEHQSTQIKGLQDSNLEYSRMMLDFQKRLNESMHAQNASEDHCRRLSMEVSTLKHEKEMLSNAEKRACDEVGRLSERVQRLQSSLDTFQSAEEVREEARAAERRKQEEHVKQIEREWALAKKELELEKDNVRALTSDREQILKNAMRQVDEMGKELANALRAVTVAETRAAVAETKVEDLGKKIRISDQKESRGLSVSPAEATTDLIMVKEELEKLRDEAQANKEHMMQYKNIAQVNEDALKQMEAAHENFKIESEKLKESLEAELISLRERISELENELRLKSEEVLSAAAGNGEALTSALAEVAALKEESSNKTSQTAALEMQVSALKEDLEKEHERWRSAQTNYERQVILQSETIQELSRTSQTLASLQEEASGLRKLADEREQGNNELKAKWEAAQSMLEESRRESQKKYDELNEQNKLLHNRLEALHIQMAESDRSSVGMSFRNSADPSNDGGLQNVVSYLRRSKEIAETEMALLRQEKLRLQSQLESALKAAENAKVSLGAERSNSRALIFSEEEMKSLQYQVSEMNLLRESNMQLIEENKHNVEECQKLHDLAQESEAKAEDLKLLLKEREREIEGLKKETEILRVDKDFLQNRMSELVEKNIHVEDYDEVKVNLQRVQEKLKEKNNELEETKNCMLKQQETLSKLENDFGRSEVELNQRERRINDLVQAEASMKNELERQKKLIFQYKRRIDGQAKEKNELLKEKHAANKQIEELKQVKKAVGNVGGELTLKEKEEKCSIIQILEKTLEKIREDLKKEKEELKKEKEDHQMVRLSGTSFVMSLRQERLKFADIYDKSKEALRRVSDALVKLKHVEGSLPEDISFLQFLSGSILDDLIAVCTSAIEIFEKEANSLLGEHGQGVPPVGTPSALDASAPVLTSKQFPLAVIHPLPSSSTPQIAVKAVEEKEKRFAVPRMNVEGRKTARKLVRPWLGKTEEPQGDAEISEAADGSNVGGKNDSEMQRNRSVLSQPVSRKRLPQSGTESSEQLINQGEAISQGAFQMPKKPKRHGSSHGEVEVQPTTSAVPPAVDLMLDTTSDVLPGSNDERVSEKEDADIIVEEKMEGSKDSDDIGGSIAQTEEQIQKTDVSEDASDKPSGTGMEIDESLKDEFVEEDQQQILESDGDQEEGEMLPDVSEAEVGGGDVSNMADSPESGEFVPDGCITPEGSPLRVEDEANSPLNAPADETDVVEETAEGSDKVNDTDDQNVVGTDQTLESRPVVVDTSANASAELDITKASSSCATEAEEVKQVSPVRRMSTLVNLSERARQNALVRIAAGAAPQPGAPATSNTASTRTGAAAQPGASQTSITTSAKAGAAPQPGAPATSTTASTRTGAAAQPGASQTSITTSARAGAAPQPGASPTLTAASTRTGAATQTSTISSTRTGAAAQPGESQTSTSPPSIARARAARFQQRLRKTGQGGPTSGKPGQG
ncbi:Nuclear-pore anchor [Linum perenne]